jgi:uncharacterized membrane protein
MKKIFNFERTIFLLVFIFSTVGIIVSFILLLETIAILKDANSNLSCNISSILNCSSVMKSKYAELFGFPNPILGLIGYSAIAGVSFSTLLNKSINKYLLWITIFGSLGAFIFSYWMLGMSVFNIRSLCPYCLISAFCATNTLFALLVYNIKTYGSAKIQKFIDKGWYFPLIILWNIAVVGFIVLEFKEFL